MNWLNVNSIEELKRCGSFKQVKKQLTEYISPLKCSPRGWNELFKVYIKVRELSSQQHINPENKITTQCNTQQPEELYFKSETERYIYTLVELDGASRMKGLGITGPSILYNKKKLKKWRDSIALKLHPDICKHPFSELAAKALNELYEELGGTNGRR